MLFLSKFNRIGACRIIFLLLVVPASSTGQDSWKATEEAASRAGKAAHFGEAEKLLSVHLKYAETLSAKDPQRPDLHQTLWRRSY
jgi:hypothetical protein